MTKDLQELFQKDTYGHVRGDFTDRTIEKIKAAADSDIRRQNWIWGTFSVLSVVASFFAGRYAMIAFMKSGFSNYFSLIFSDSKLVMSSLKDFGLLLLESLPVIGIGIFLGSLSALLWSAKKLFKRKGILPMIGNVA